MTFCDDASDDPTIDDADVLIRAVHPRMWARVMGVEATFRPIRPAFNETSDGSGCSINLWSILQANDLPKTFVPDELVDKRRNYGFVEFPASITRLHKAKVLRDALPTNAAHGVICNLSEEAKTDLSRKARVISFGHPQPQK